MGTSLLIVESPSKAKTIKKYLGKGFEVTASVGHIKDLPKNSLGVDVEKDFEPEYVALRGKNKVLKEIRALAKKADAIYLGPDPDREGEAIAWHLADVVKRSNKKAQVFRVMINEITKKGVKAALQNPQELNRDRFESQQARRILDRLVGYTISPLLWDKVRRGLSAGRVQSVAVRLIVDRERDINAFDPEEYWTIEAELEGQSKPAFAARLLRIASDKAEVKNQEQADTIVSACREGRFVVSAIKRRERKRNPHPPFTTSKLQQTAAQQLRFTTKRTMQTAQKLYEGIELGDEGAVGLITYMRTDSVRISDDALKACRNYIKTIYGKEELPAKPRTFKVKKGAQDAHEAIRPTSMDYPPAVIKRHLTREQYKLYKLIWDRFVASQMNPAIYDQTSIDIVNGPYTFRASGSILKSPGFLKVSKMRTAEDEDDSTLPELTEGEELTCHQITPTQHFTQPPPRFSEATLVKELEDKGIGRPSTYASIISTIQDKNYCEKDTSGRFVPTELGTVVTGLLVESFPRIMDTSFTAGMEEELDSIEQGQLEWTGVLKKFYDPFNSMVEEARDSMRNLKAESRETDIVCSECERMMVIKWGKNGYFLACSGYPDCKNTAEFTTDEDGTIRIVEEEVVVVGECDKCGGDLIVKTGRYGRFLACNSYPECKNTKPFSLGVPCPTCSSDLIEKRSRRGRTFYGCSSYPDCTFAVWDEPVHHDCPACGSPYLLRQSRRGGDAFKCNECGESYLSIE
ncbi:MAG: type I DNA topoisomerase, partial [Myxococcota bacterium]